MAKTKKLRWAVFLIPWLLSIAAIGMSFVSGEVLTARVMTVTILSMETV